MSAPDMSGFADFDSGHRDLVIVTKFNFYGNRILTASSDHRIKVWDRRDGQWQLTDTWRAHDAEIRDVSKASQNTNIVLYINFPSGYLEWSFHRSASRQCW